MKKVVMVFIMSVICLTTCVSAFAGVIGSARISLTEGDVLIQTEDTGNEWIAASINFPLIPGDKIWVPENGRSEIQFLGGSYIRADNNTALDITNLSRDSEGNITQLAVIQGRTYINYNGSYGSNSVFQVDTPLVSAIAYSSAIFDVSVYKDGYTEVTVIKGPVFVEGQYGNTKVNTGDMLSVSAYKYAGLSPGRLNDGWLIWNTSRDSLIAKTGTSIKYLPSSLYDYSADFDRYGYWVHTPDYGYVWSPRITINTWAPYRDGRWIWRNNDYVWVSYERWGWVPYHYGRWGFSVGIGWFWVPPAVHDVFWGPGFVAWINMPTYISWVPLAPGEIYYGHGHYGRHSVNITKVNVTNINVTNVYLNSKVAHAVTVVHHDNFAKGIHVKVTNAPANPFLAGSKLSAGRPSIKQINHSPLPLKVVQQEHLPPKAMLDTKRTTGLSSRNLALNKNISVFKGSKPVSSMHVNVVKDPESISSNQKVSRVEPRTTPQASNQ
ncbi:MAG: FecR domain-containing protein, partial [Nitrospirae bacterium]|nr:FecR domain-containing protein [Nitrospirota bacterium]